MKKRFTIKVVPNSSKNSIEQQDGIIKIRLIAPATEGKANEELIYTLASYFKVKRKSVSIITGERGRNKIIEIDFEE